LSFFQKDFVLTCVFDDFRRSNQLGTCLLKLVINGEPKDFSEGISLEELIRQLGVRKETVVAEVNRKIIRMEQRPVQKLSDGDQIELIQFVGGG